MEEKTLQDYLNVPISEFRDVLNGKQENDFGVDIVRIRQAADELAEEMEDDSASLYNSFSVAVTRGLPCIDSNHIFLNGVRIPVHAKMISKRIAKMWLNREPKEKIKIEWESLLENNRIKL